MEEKETMSKNIIVKQTTGIGGDNLQIGQQNNYFGMSPQEAVDFAMKLFMDNFPRLQDIAKETVERRVDEFCKETILKMQKNNIINFSPFADPDMQYILYEAEKGYARFGKEEMLDTLTTLISKRVEHDSDFILKVTIDKAISVAPMMSPAQLDYLSLLFWVKSVFDTTIKSIDALEMKLKTLDTLFECDSEVFEYLQMLGCLELNIGDACDRMAKTYGFDSQDVERICPNKIKQIPGDYGVSYIGTILAIANIETKTNKKFNPHIWIK